MRGLLLALLLLASPAFAAVEALHPPQGGGALPGLPFPMEFGGTGSPVGAFTEDRCVESYLDSVDLKLKLRSSAAPCPTTQNGLTGVIDVTKAPYNADNMCGSDATSAINAARAALSSTTSGTLYLPAGCYLISDSIQLQSGTNVDNVVSGMNVQGAGKGATRIVSDTAGTGFSMFRVATPRSCTGGTGSCDARINTAARGASCLCYTNTDCQSGTCAGGSVQRNITIRDLALVMAKDNMVALDAAFMGEAHFDNLSIAADDGLTHQNTIGALFSDGNGSVSGYSATITNSMFGQADVCARVMKQANDVKFIADEFSPNCGTGLAIDNGVNATAITNCAFQSTRTPVCTASACVGGYFHGKACTVGADCGEADIVNLGLNTQIWAPRIEDSRNQHILCGESSTTCPTCGTFTAQEMTAIGGYHSGSTTYIKETTSRCQRPTILLNDFLTTNVTNRLGGNGFDQILFEGATVNSFKTILTAADPTAARTITLPDATGTVLLTTNTISNVLLSSDDQNATPTWQISGHGKNMLYGIDKLSNVAITGNTGTISLSSATSPFTGGETGANSTFTIVTAATDTVILSVTTTSGSLPTSVFNNTSALWASAQFRTSGPYPQTMTVEAKYDDGLGAVSYHTIGTLTSNTSSFPQKSLVFSPAISGGALIYAVRWTFANWNTTGAGSLLTAGLHHKSEHPFPNYLRRDGQARALMLGPLGWMANLGTIAHVRGPSDQKLTLRSQSGQALVLQTNDAATDRVSVDTAGGVTIGGLAGGSTRIVGADTAGKLVVYPTPTGTPRACPTADRKGGVIAIDGSGAFTCLITPTPTATPTLTPTPTVTATP